MKNRKFSLLINDFIQLTQGTLTNVGAGDALVCRCGNRVCRIEDGHRVGLTNQLIVLVEMAELDNRPDLALSLNGDFRQSYDGYFAQLPTGEINFVRHLPIIEYPQELLHYLSETVAITSKLSKEIVQHVVD